MGQEKNAFTSFNGKELLDFISRTSETKHVEAITSFTDNVTAVTTAISNLYEEYKMDLFIEGITVSISVEALKGKILETKIGPNKADVLEVLGAMIKCTEKFDV